MYKNINLNQTPPPVGKHLLAGYIERVFSEDGSFAESTASTRSNSIIEINDTEANWLEIEEELEQDIREYVGLV